MADREAVRFIGSITKKTAGGQQFAQYPLARLTKYLLHIVAEKQFQSESGIKTDGTRERIDNHGCLWR